MVPAYQKRVQKQIFSARLYTQQHVLPNKISKMKPKIISNHSSLFLCYDINLSAGQFE